jgi:hypothetical protein
MKGRIYQQDNTEKDPEIDPCEKEERVAVVG